MSGEARCPVCKRAVRATLIQHLPGSGWKQYKCPHCGYWLTIDGRTRFFMVVVHVATFMSLVVPVISLMERIRQISPLERQLFAGFFLTLAMVGSFAACAFIAQRLGGWVVAPKSAWDLPSWVHRDK